MRIVALEAAHIDDVIALYLRATRDVPHCRFVPSPPKLTAALDPARPEHAPLLVATEAGVPRGFAALDDHRESADGRRTAAITALFVDRAGAGHLLLDAASAWAQARGAQRLLAFPPTHFQSPIPGYNGGWDGLSDRVELVANLLARHGFTPFHRELHLECTGASFPPVPITAPPGIRTVERIEARGQTIVAALDMEQEVGTGEYSLLTRISDHTDAAHWGYIWGLDVAEAARRRGIGRYLMSYALSDLSTRGCRGGWLTTEAMNWPAQALYLALGFTIVDSSTCFHKDLQAV